MMGLDTSVLHEFIAVNRNEIIRRCRAKVAARSMPPPTDREIDHGVPVFLDQLVNALRLGLSSSPEIGWTALPTYTARAPLRRSGLIGPVRLLGSK